jgi:hypothetical protein
MQNCDMPRQPLVLVWRDNARRQLEGTPLGDGLWCDVLSIQPRLRLKWWYTEAQAEEGDVWECSAVWLHCPSVPNGTVYPEYLHRDLQAALRRIQEEPESSRYTLLVAQEGMSYDPMRLGGDHHVQVHGTDGRRFTFSVRRAAGRQTKVLLALAWGAV